MASNVTKTFMFEGKRYYVRAKTEEEAIVKAALRLRDLEGNARRVSRNMLVSAWAMEWLDVYKEPIVSYKHYKNIRTIINNVIVPIIGSMQMKNVKPVHLQGILNDMSLSYSNSYISFIYGILFNMFKDAYHNGLTIDNPAEGIKKPRGKHKKSRRAITSYERKLTLQVAETYRGGTFVLIMLYCGLRPGEVAALTWSNVDLKNKIIHVQQALKSDGVIGPPKTQAGYRDVPMPDILIKRLKDERLKSKSIYVCTNTLGERYNHTAIKTMFRTYRNEMNKAAGCKVFRGQVQPPYVVDKDLSLYCYRHTYCTDLQAAGVPINVAKELMGHSNIAVTAQIYTHKSDTAFNNAASLINTYLTADVALSDKVLEISRNRT